MLSLKNVNDEVLLRQLGRLVRQSRGVEAEVVAHIDEVDRRRLYAREACSSMFDYCRRVLGLRENEAYLRITVARTAREYPDVLDMLRDGRLHLSGIARLAPHLGCENAQSVLKRACGMSHREVRELVAELEPKPDVAPTIRKLPERPAASSGSRLQLGAPRVPLDTGEPPANNLPTIAPSVSKLPAGAPTAGDPTASDPPAIKLSNSDPTGVDHSVRLASRPTAPARPALVEPLAPGRYQVRFTASADLRDKLERLQSLLRSAVPDGDLARIIDIAVSEKLERVEARRFGRTKSPRRGPSRQERPSSRHIPAMVRRAVYERDGGRCAYRDLQGRRCEARHSLEFHHRHPFAHGGEHSPANLSLLCGPHNRLLAEQDYGEDVMARFRGATGPASVPVDACDARAAVRPSWSAPG